MKISLIYPLLSRKRSKIDENKQYWPPLGLAYIAAVLEKDGHRVQILDRDYILRKNKFDFDITDEVTLGQIKNFGTEIVGFSATTPNISDVDYFSRKIKKADNKIITVVGGPHCIGEPVLTLQICNDIDMLVRGEGELVMLDIVSGKGLESIGSLTYRIKGGSVFSNPDRPLIESLDSLPMPARHLLDMEYYTRPSRFISRNLSLSTTHIFTARGCPYNCYYCAGPLMGRRVVRYHSAQRVILEIEELIAKYSVEAVYFAEDMFLSDKKRAKELIDLLIERGINKKIVWMAQVNPKAVDIELLSMMKNAGCVHVEYGFESGSQRTLDLMNKKVSVTRNMDVATLTKKIGLRFQGNFIVGYPGETEEDFNKTVSFIRKTRPNNISLNIFMPLPGTQIYKQLRQEGKAILDWDDFGNPEAPYINYAAMPKSHFEELYFKAKLEVVLPINLMHFIKDNIRHPFRLVYVIATQFKSVLIRAFKAEMALFRIHRKHKSVDVSAKALFIAYHSIFYPIMESQALAYIRYLSKNGIRYSLFTFETKETLRLARVSSKKTEWDKLYNWRHLLYHKKPRLFATLLDIICGMFMAAFIIQKERIKIIHARGLIPAILAFLPAKILGAKLFFDTRGFLADKYVGGGLLKKDGFTYSAMRSLEELLLRRSDFFTVETLKHAAIIKNLCTDTIAAKMEVVPCCVDMQRFNYLPHLCSDRNSKFNLVYLGKIGTWYLIDEMLDFYAFLTKKIDNSFFTFITQDDPAAIYFAAEKKEIDFRRIIVKKPLNEDIPLLLAQADLGIFFINSYRRYNSSPIKYGEYLASGLPVVINSGIGDTEDITDKENIGVIVKEFSNDSYDAAINKLKLLLKEKGVLRKRCRLVAEKYFSLEKGAEKYLMIYKKLMSK